MNGITTLRNMPLPVNLALYMAESEQRPAAIITDIRMEQGRCTAALAVMVETLPGATKANIERSIANLARVQEKGLLSYLKEHGNVLLPTESSTDTGFIPTIQVVNGGEISNEQRARAEEMFQALDSPLDKILDDCLVGMDAGSIRWDRKPKFKCTCGMDRVWRALRLLPREELQGIVDSQEPVQMNCEFCGAHYGVSCEEVRNQVLSAKPAVPPLKE